MAQNSDRIPDSGVEERFARTVDDLKRTLDRLTADHARAVGAVVADVLAAWRSGGKLLVCGNGGSAADAEHLVAELVGRYHVDRPGWAALALTDNSSR